MTITMPFDLTKGASLPIAISASGRHHLRKQRTRLLISTAESWSLISPALVRELRLFPAGQSTLRQPGCCPPRPKVNWYLVDVHFVYGLLGAENHRFVLERCIVYEAEIDRAGIMAGLDMLSTGRLLLNSDSISFCV